jgi:hypothetical protein
MAITRTQIAKQLLEQGGRVGLQGGGADLGAGASGMGSGTTGNDNRERGMEESMRQAQRRVDLGALANRGADDKLQEQLETFRQLGNRNSLKNKLINFIPGIGVLNRFIGPFNQRDYMLDKMSDRQLKNFANLDEDKKETVYDSFMEDQRNRFTSDESEGGDTPIIPQGIMAQAPVEEEDDYYADQGGNPFTNRIPYRLMSKGGRAAFGGGSDMGSVADSKGNVGPGAGGYQGGGTEAVDDRSNAGQTAVNNAAIMMAQMQNQNLDKSPNLIEKFPSGRVIDKINLNKMIADMNLNTITEEDDEDTNVIDTVFSEKPAADLQTVFGTGLSNRQQIGKNILDSMADGGRAGLAEGGMPYEGGIMDLESARQMYGLGKLVKKVTRSVKKIAKSPIGKAAIGALVFNYGFKGKKDFGFMDKLFGMPGGNKLVADTPGILGTLGLTKGGGSLMPTALGGIGLTSLAAGLMTPKQEEEETVEFERGEPLNIANIRANPGAFQAPRFMAEGGSTEEKEPVAKKVMPLLDMDGQEKDYRETGGFVDMGRMEKADDVPARLSKNEFVFTADAVRNAGDGSVDKGAEVMYNMMKNLESGGDVSEESQGLEGARDMFQTSQRLEEVL